MQNDAVSRKISVRFGVLLGAALCCLGCLAAFSTLTLRTILDGQTAHSQSFVPAKRLTANFERETLNARIHFIYFVTIQKPGSLDKGWERWHNAEARLGELSAHVAKHDELANLRGPVQKLHADVDSYREALTSVLQMVQSGELKGPHYDAQVKEWAARGAVMVTDAGSVETLAFNTSEASTGEIVRTLRDARTTILAAWVFGMLLCAVVAYVMARRVTAVLQSVSAGAVEQATTTAELVRGPVVAGRA